MTSVAPSRWAMTRSAVTTVLAGVVLLAVGVIAGRADLAVLGVAPVLLVAWSRRAETSGEVTVTSAHAPSADDDSHTPGTTTASRHLAATVRVDAPLGTSVRMRVSRPGSIPAEVVVDARAGRVLRASTPSVRTGPQPLFTVDHVALGPGEASASGAGRLAAPSVLVLPAARLLPVLPLPFRLRGLTGNHGSRRPGAGGDLRDVHTFTPGDRLRRIDWRVTAKRSPDLRELYVRRSFALADAVVVLAVDSRDDAGPDAGTWSGLAPVRPDERTSLDLAREAAASVARAALASGDRVGLHDLGDPRRPVPAGAGRRQLDRIALRLATTQPHGRPADTVRAPQLPSGALVVLFSTFLDPHAALVARQWRRAGHRVLAVDVLPPLLGEHLEPRERLAVRMVRIERTDRLAELAAQGVEVFAWAGGTEAARADAGGAALVGAAVGAVPGPEVELLRLGRRSHRHVGAQVGR